MIRILYFSTARANLTRADVDAIASHASEANLKRGITGSLAYNGRNFCQCLEGEEGQIRALIETIRKDDRHSGFKVLDEKTVQSRYFKDWGLRLVDDLDFSYVINAMSADSRDREPVS